MYYIGDEKCATNTITCYVYCSSPCLLFLVLHTTDTLRFTDFCASLRDLFGEDIQSKDMKGVYRKISTNPDAYVDWCEVSWDSR